MALPDPMLLLAGSPSSGEQSPFASLLLMALIFSVFYFVLILPVRQKQKKTEEMIKGLKAGDRVVLNSGIFGTVVAVEDDAFAVRIDQNTKVKVLKSAVAALQGPAETEKK
jgi:preprotein translocase subunit YajC